MISSYWRDRGGDGPPLVSARSRAQRQNGAVGVDQSGPVLGVEPFRPQILGGGGQRLARPSWPRSGLRSSISATIPLTSAAANDVPDVI